MADLHDVIAYLMGMDVSSPLTIRRTPERKGGGWAMDFSDLTGYGPFVGDAALDLRGKFDRRLTDKQGSPKT